MAILNSCFLNIFLTIATLVTFLLLYVKYRRTYWQRRGVPTLPAHWFFGNVKDVMQFKKSPSIVIGDLHSEASDNDDVLGIYIFHKPFLLLRNAELIKQILIKDFDYFPDRYFTAQSIRDKIGSSNLFTMHNPEWRQMRTKISPVFSSGKMKKLFHLIGETAGSMIKYLEQQFSHDAKTKTIFVRDIALRYTTDIISSVAFGIKVNSFDPETVQFFEKAQEGTRITFLRAIQFSVMFFFPQFSKWIAGQMLGSSTNYFRKIFWNSMDTRNMTKAKRGDLIDSLIDLKNKNDLKLEGDELVSQAAIFFVAGRESSVTTICLTLYELAKHPEIQKRTREEIHEKLKEHGMTYEAFQSMKYLNQVISETLRIYPPAPLIDRICVKDYKIHSILILTDLATKIKIISNNARTCLLAMDQEFASEYDSVYCKVVWL
uniref:cytochrome P450 6k1-like isoform X2 n=1 Tax=Bombus vancouverensis nearcticus TaxID=2705178 RepID=UPI00143C1943|nr:cytochrome P450 6k1-like isoform X2 [Bombus vancouverensis nearcticus]